MNIQDVTNNNNYSFNQSVDLSNDNSAQVDQLSDDQDNNNAVRKDPSEIVSAKTGFTPTKWYGIQKKHNGRRWTQKLDLKLVDLKAKGVYYYVNTEDGIVYVGKADDGCQRIRRHQYVTNNPESSYRKKHTKQKLYQDINDKGHAFQFGWTKLSSGQSPRKVEKKITDALKAQGIPLYNLVDGGGGPKAKKKLNMD